MNKRLYNIWSCMKQRCNNPNHTAAYWYHDKGIRVCNEWNKCTNFEKWAMSSGYRDNLTIDRINADGNYEPNNCRWISIEENRALARTSQMASSKSTRRAKRGRFMVVRTNGAHATSSFVKVIKTGLTKSEALKLSSQLKKKEPYSDNWFYDRVTDKHKEGEIVMWDELRRYINKNERR